MKNSKSMSSRDGFVNFAEGGKVPDDEGSMSGMIPKSLHKLWGMIPSAADIAVTGKISATPQEYDKAREHKERQIEAREKNTKGK